jgi:tetratricopeptide (TPR) repeat protein
VSFTHYIDRKHSQAEHIGLREIFGPTTICDGIVSFPAGPVMYSQDKGKDLGSAQALQFDANSGRLNSWKEIARYLKREVRTVQLWEKHEALPVHRHFHNRQGTVFAFRHEVDTWWELRASARTNVQATSQEMAVATRHRVVLLANPPTDPMDGAALVGMLTDVTRMLDVAKVELLPAAALASTDFILRWKTFLTSDCAVAELFSVRLQSVIWSHIFTSNRPQDSQEASRLAQEIHECLWLQSVSSIKFISHPSHVPKAGAREAYVKGRYLWSRRTEEDLRKAVGCFRMALWRDPEFALAYTGLADSLTLLSFYEIISPAEAMPHARAAARRALDLDPNLAEAHTSLADVNLHFDMQWDAAGQGYRRAIECNPGYALVYHWYANLLSATGQHDAAHFAVMQALEIDPSSLITQVWAGVTSYFARRYDDAIRHYRNALELDQDYTWAHMYMAQALEQKGLYPEALSAFDTAIRLAGGSNCVSAMKAHAYAVAGEREAAIGLLGQLQRVPFGKCVPSYDIAATHVALGDTRQALRWLQRACGERNMKLFTLSQDPRFDALRDCSEFYALMQRVNTGGVQTQLSLMAN